MNTLLRLRIRYGRVCSRHTFVHWQRLYTGGVPAADFLEVGGYLGAQLHASKHDVGTNTITLEYRVSVPDRECSERDEKLMTSRGFEQVT